MSLDFARPVGNFLRPNLTGGYIIRQSDLSSWSRCQLQKYYYDLAANEPDAPQPEILSATEFGTVIHHVLMNMELAMHEGVEDALPRALKQWEYFWDPANISAVPGARWPTTWIGTDSLIGLRQRGRQVLEIHYETLKADKSFRLALEYQFAVPIVVNGRTHTLTGTIDRLAVRMHSNRKPYVGLDDNKTGKKPNFLRWNNQGTAYGYASTTPEFWTGWSDSGMGGLETFDEETIARLDHVFESHGYALHSGSPAHRERGLPLASRRFRWIDLKYMKFSDGGWRVAQDYERLKLVIDSYVRACEAEIYSVNLTAEICQYCAFRKVCGGVGMPEPQVGAP